MFVMLWFVRMVKNIKVTNEKGEAFRVGAFKGYKIDFFLDNQMSSNEG